MLSGTVYTCYLVFYIIFSYQLIIGLLYMEFYAGKLETKYMSFLSLILKIIYVITISKTFIHIVHSFFQILLRSIIIIIIIVIIILLL